MLHSNKYSPSTDVTSAGACGLRTLGGNCPIVALPANSYLSTEINTPNLIYSCRQKTCIKPVHFVKIEQMIRLCG